ncbi:FHA domain-containing protein [Leifsonia poae]|uniref:FHA domain-containing protein n=1 Tax=Leifsonia poae TaxID=110933 RepID=UPI001CBFC8AB|nr:FHA domain-containing protein [Leifsonia poae]
MFEVQQAASGEWTVVVSGRRVLLVEAPEQVDRIGSYRRALADGFAAALEALAVDGFARTPAFALAETGDGQVLLAVRGIVTATLTVDGTERIVDAAGVSTWLEQQVAGVSALRLAVPGHDSLLAPLPLCDGAVWATTVAWPAAAQPERAPQNGAAPRRAPITAPIVVEAQPPAEAEAPAEAEPPAVIPIAQATIAEATIAEATIAAPAEAAGYDHLFGATLMRSVEDAAVRPETDDVDAPARIDIPGFITDSAPPPATEREGDHDGMTVFSGSFSERRDRGGADQPAPMVAPVAAAPRFFVDLFDGRREYLVPPIVVGRSPVASSTSRGPVPRPITVTSDEQDISRSHATIAVEGDSVVVTDLHSRNGTVIVLPGKSPQKLRQGEPTTVIAGTVVDLGSGITLTVGQDA